MQYKLQPREFDVALSAALAGEALGALEAKTLEVESLKARIAEEHLSEQASPSLLSTGSGSELKRCSAFLPSRGQCGQRKPLPCKSKSLAAVGETQLL